MKPIKFGELLVASKAFAYISEKDIEEYFESKNKEELLTELFTMNINWQDREMVKQSKELLKNKVLKQIQAVPQRKLEFAKLS